MKGVLVVDKPRGITSFDVVARVRRIFGEKRVGHTGTLDPMATGVLVVCLGEATKLVPALTDADKAYEAEALLGVETDSEDATGVVTARVDAGRVTRDDVARVLADMTGEVAQTPPMHSAIRVDGERLYERARRGETIERAARKVRIDSLSLLAFAPNGDTASARFSVRCGKGTYVRTIGAELGRQLGVGAHLTALRRTEVGPFDLGQAIPLDVLRADQPMLGLAESVAHLPTVVVPAELLRGVRDGKLSVIEQLQAPGAGRIRLVGPSGGLLAIAQSEAGKIVLERVFNDVDIDPGFGPNTATKKLPETKDL